MTLGKASDRIVTGNTEQTQPENRVFYPALDGLRGVAFLMVFFQHYANLVWGWAGVDLFFVLSGFLITGILYDTRNDTHRVSRFYIRRSLRIFPLYYGLMLGIVLLDPLVHWQWNWSWLVWPAYLGNFARYFHPVAVLSPLQRLSEAQLVGTFGHRHGTITMGHFWSLCVEEQFYLMWPWVVFWVKDRRKLLWICAASIPVCLAMRIAGEFLLPQWIIAQEVFYRATPFRLDALLTGGLIAFLLRGPLAPRLLRAARLAAPVVLGMFVLWAIVSPSGRIWQRPYVYPDWRWTWMWGLTIIDLLAALLILLAIQPRTYVYKALHWRPLRWLGGISYGAYVLHGIPHTLYIALASAIAPHYPVLATCIIALAMTILLAWLSFTFYESFFLNLKERWAPSYKHGKRKPEVAQSV